MDLIMTLGASYQYYHLKPMFETLASTGYQGDFVFFYTDLSPKTLKKLEKYPYTLIPYNYQYPYVDDGKIIEVLTEAPDFTPHPKTLRYLLYNAYLKAYNDKYDKVFIGDCRDLVFQKAPFEGFELSGLHCFEEDRVERIGTNFFNSLWIKEAFGEQTLLEIAEKPIICSGTTYGSLLAMIDYTELMIETIKKVRDHGCKDQGIHNYLIHTNKLPNVMLHQDDNGPVSTLSLFKPYGSIRINDKLLVIDQTDNVINIVHQYDRHWGLLWKYNKRAFIKKKVDYLKQFLLAIKKNRKISRLYLSNLRSIFMDPMVKKYDWD